MEKDMIIRQAFFDGELFLGGVGMHNMAASLLPAPKKRQELTAYHVLLTSPWSYHHPDEPFFMPEFERQTAFLSALAWRRYNGPICLVTDGPGAEYFRKYHMDQVYDDVLEILDRRNYGIDPSKFWAAGKIQALCRIKAPCLLMDLDLIVWKELDVDGCLLAAAHTEPLDENIYPSPDFFLMSPYYTWPAWDTKALPLNTSIAYFGDEDFKNYYAKESVRFMQYERDTLDNGSWCMVFAEQRILGMCAASWNISVKTYLEYDRPLEKQDLVTHLWSGKGLFRSKKSFRDQYMILCEDKIGQFRERGSRLWTK